jgi:hypothetical protein
MTIEGELGSAICRLPISAGSREKLESLVSKFPLHLLSVSSNEFFASSPQWRELWLGDSTDFPHNFIHARRAVNNGLVAGAVMGLSEKEILTISAGLWVHDLGRMMVARGLIDDEDHDLGSWVMAMELLFQNKKIDVEAAARAALLHSHDVLPEEATIIDRVVRDADRIELLPWSAVVRYAYFPPFNFKHPIFDSKPTPTDWLDADTFLARGGLPWKPGYERGLKRFCLQEVFPFLVKHNLLRPMLERCDDGLKHIDGVKHADGSWQIEPVTPEIKEAFYRKVGACAEFTTLLVVQDYREKYGSEVAAQMVEVMKEGLRKNGLGEMIKPIERILKFLI